MSTLTLRRENPLLPYREEAQLIVDRLAALGITISLVDAHAAWTKNSHALATHWLPLPSNDALLVEDIKRHCDEAE